MYYFENPKLKIPSPKFKESRPKEKRQLPEAVPLAERKKIMGNWAFKIINNAYINKL